MTTEEAGRVLEQTIPDTPMARYSRLLAHVTVMNAFAQPGNGGAFNRALAAAMADLCASQAMQEL